MRMWLALMFGATVWVTSPVWGVHDDPTMLPLVEFPPFQYFGHLMFAGYVAAVWWPRAGLAASVVAGLMAMIADQTRMQPTIFSFWLLMLGTWSRREAVFIARCHLASLWFFSGFHKLLSEGYFEQAGPWLFHGIFPVADWPRMVEWEYAGSFAMAAFELALGVAALVPRLRKAAAAGALFLHLGIVITLQRLGNWNTAVWPWNLALAVVGPWLMITWNESLVGGFRTVGRRGAAAGVAGVAMALSPLLYYVGMLDPYLCHCLYSSNVPQASLYRMPSDPNAPVVPEHFANAEGPYMRNLNVPFPPAHRNFEIYFRRMAGPLDRLVVSDQRACAVRGGYDYYYLMFEADGSVTRKPLPKSR
jgi:uncharacterized membrane protein YphA (DoxX/SURF4 family)